MSKCEKQDGIPTQILEYHLSSVIQVLDAAIGHLLLYQLLMCRYFESINKSLILQIASITILRKLCPKYFDKRRQLKISLITSEEIAAKTLQVIIHMNSSQTYFST